MGGGAVAKESGVINVRGRDYKTVAARVQEFRATHPLLDGWAIRTRLLTADAEVVRVKAWIVNPAGRIVADGHAEEVRSKNTRDVNFNAAVENAETSAIGRALAAAGYAGQEYASADELHRKLAGKEGQDGPRNGHQRHHHRDDDRPADVREARPWWQQRHDWFPDASEFGAEVDALAADANLPLHAVWDSAAAELRGAGLAKLGDLKPAKWDRLRPVLEALRGRLVPREPGEDG